MRANDIKSANQLRLLQHIRRQGRVSQAALAAANDLRPSTVSVLMRPLKDAGLVEIVGRGASGTVGGKRPELISLNGPHASFAGIYVREQEVDFHVMDYAETETHRDRRALSQARPEEVIEVIAEGISAIAADTTNFGGTGIAVSSVVAPRGDIEPSAGFHWSLPDFKSRLLEEVTIDAPLVLENDANCAAIYADQWLKNRYEHLMTVLANLQTGLIGSGVITGGALYRGSRGAAGELWDPALPLARTEGLWDDEVGHLRRLAYHVATARSIIDPDITVLCDGLPADAPENRELERLLEHVGLSGRLAFLEDTRSPVLGACLLAAREYEQRFVRRN
jgi:DNA-binding transcriptional ArsR family regulator